MEYPGKKYTIDKNQGDLPDKDILKYKDYGKLTYNYQRFSRKFYRKPLYKNPKYFLLLLITLLLLWLISEWGR